MQLEYTELLKIGDRANEPPGYNIQGLLGRAHRYPSPKSLVSHCSLVEGFFISVAGHLPPENNPYDATGVRIKAEPQNLGNLVQNFKIG